LDLARWTALWHRLGAQGDGGAVFTEIAAAYDEPARAYHTAEHIADCLAQFDLSRHLARQADVVEAAIWFHDLVYVPGRPDNEELSAARARTMLRAALVPSEVAGRINALVLETHHATTAHEADGALLCDIDLSILGRSPEAFARFERQIRQEYAGVPESMYRRGRSHILRTFLARASIYQTDWFRQRFERRARSNLEQLLTTLLA
jgi:predicted metal-dependent HD superfamily phosphohydrolase